MPERPPTNPWDVAKIAVICVTICILSMVSTASNLKDGSEALTGGISIGTVAAVLIGMYKSGKL